MDANTLNEARHALLDYALQAGAQAADVLSQISSSVEISALNGAVEDAVRSESVGLGLRVMVGNSQAFVSTADLRPESLKAVAIQAAGMARVIPPDPYIRLARPDELARDIAIPDLYDGSGEPSAEMLKEMAFVAEKSGLGIKGITRSEGAQASWGITHVGLSATNGFDASYAQTGSYLSASMIAGQDTGMERDYAGTGAVFFADLEAPDVIGARAGARAISRIGAQPGKTGRLPVIFDRRVSSSLVRILSRAISGSRLAKGTSFLNDAAGKAIMAKGITIVDDPLKPRGLRSVPFDGEGLAVQRRIVIENGVLTGYFLDLRSAARMNLAPTGHASRGLSSPPAPAASNLWIENGPDSLDALIAGIDEGLLVTEMMGSSINLATGDYSRGASGFWISGGKIRHPVAEMTVAGNLKDMFLNMRAANDLQHVEGIDAPAILIEGMTVATR